MIGSPQGAVTVIKIGGGLTWVPQALDRACRAVGQASREWPIVVVPGGGPFADVVREFDHRVGVSSDVAHWMAILAMDQYAHVLVERIPGAVLVEDPGAIGGALPGTGVAVLAPSRWLRAADVLPHDWAATSDSAAAFVAGALDAERLVLIKPAPGESAVDPHFALVLPVGLPWSTLGWQEAGELGKLLDG